MQIVQNIVPPESLGKVLEEWPVVQAWVVRRQVEKDTCPDFLDKR